MAVSSRWIASCAAAAGLGCIVALVYFAVRGHSRVEPPFERARETHDASATGDRGAQDLTSLTPPDGAKPIDPSASPSDVPSVVPSSVPGDGSPAPVPPQGPAGDRPIPKDAKPATGVVTGRVVNRNFEPIEGVAVHVAVARRDYVIEKARRGERAGRTDADGAYQVEVPLGHDQNLVFVHPGYAEAVRPGVRARKNEMVMIEEVVLGTGAILTGLVVDGNERPIAEAAVKIHSSETELYAYVNVEADESDASTGKDGRFRIEHVKPGHCVVTAFVAGMPPGASNVLSPAEGATVDLRIVVERGESITGRVVDAQSKPLADVSVRPFPAGERREPADATSVDASSADASSMDASSMDASSADGVDVTTFDVEATTDASGAFVLEGLRHGRYTLRIRRDHVWHDSDPIPTGSRDVVVVIPLTGTIRGWVTTSDGIPAGSFDVMATGGPQDFRFRGSTSVEPDSGRFELLGLASGTYQVSVTSRGWLPAQVDDVVVRAGETTQVAIPLERGGFIEGVVRAGDTPVQGVRVIVFPTFDRGVMEDEESRLDVMADMDTDMFAGQERKVRTKPDGTFRIEGLESGRYTAKASHPDFVGGSEKDIAVTVGVDTPPVTIQLSRGGAIEGTAFGTDGLPLPGVGILAGPTAKVHTDGNGNYRFDALRPGPTMLRIARGPDAAIPNLYAYTQPLYAYTRPASKDLPGVRVVVVNGQTVRQNLWEVPGASIEGVVREYGRAVGGVHLEIFFRGADSGLAIRTTDENGRYSFLDLDPGTYALRIVAQDDREVVRLEIAVDAGDKARRDIDLPTSFVEGQVLAMQGRRPVFGARVRLEALESEGPFGADVEQWFGDAESAQTDLEGRFRIELVRPGSYRLSAVAAGFAEGVVDDITVGEEGSSDAEILLPEGGSIRLRLVDAVDGTVIQGAMLLFDGEPRRQGQVLDWYEAGPDGFFDLESFPPGNCRVRCGAPGYDPGEAVVRVEGGERTERTVTLRRSKN